MRLKKITLLVLFLLSAPLYAQASEPVAPVNNEVAAADEKPVQAVLNTKEKGQLARVESYLSSIRTISARFSQVSPDGAIANGKFYLQHPGKLRMEYEPPVPVLVVTNKGSLVYYDSELDQVTNVPLDSTLVGFLARENIRFDNTVMVTHFEQGKKSLRLSLVQPKRPKDGNMTLEFSDSPLQLRNIVMSDGAGQSTVVSLSDAVFDTQLDPALFIFKDPHLTSRPHIKK